MKNQGNNNATDKWLIKFKGNHSSLYYNLNFLWKSDNIYIMDNHRAAMWCWLQEISLKEKYDLFHIDRHFDTLYSNIKSWLQIIPNLESLELDQYLNLKEEDNKTPVIQYGNYLSIFLEKYARLLNTCWFSTYNEGDEPRWKVMQTLPPRSIPSCLEYLLEQNTNQWIINLDIDLFFCDDENESQIQLHSDAYIECVGEILKHQRDKGKIAVITIALSPEWSGGWEESKRICNILTKAMNINFILPS